MQPRPLRPDFRLGSGLLSTLLTSRPMSLWLALLCVLGSYGLGSVSFALLLVRGLRGVDLRSVGSGNLGATNAGRVLGRRWAIVIYLLDFAKGCAPTLIGLHVHVLAETSLGHDFLPLPMVMGAAAFLGHCYPVHLGFRGGKGVATASGVVLAVSPLTFVAGVAAFGLMFLAFRMISLGSIVSSITLPVAFLATERREALELPNLAWLTFFLGIAILVIVRHRANIHRIVEGTEPRVGRPVA